MNRTGRRNGRGKTECERAWLMVRWLMGWLWELFDRTMKAFFDALLDHLTKT